MGAVALTREIRYFAYGTLQKGLPNYPDLSHVVGEPLGRYRTATPHALVVPHAPGCANPGCKLLHRMAALVPDTRLHVEGDLFLIDADGLAAVDRLESYVEGGDGPYVRRETEVVPVDGGQVWTAQAFHVVDPLPWRRLVDQSEADLLTHYTLELAGASSMKTCCSEQPGHRGPHDIVDLF